MSCLSDDVTGSFIRILPFPRNDVREDLFQYEGRLELICQVGEGGRDISADIRLQISVWRLMIIAASSMRFSSEEASSNASSIACQYHHQIPIGFCLLAARSEVWHQNVLPICL